MDIEKSLYIREFKLFLYREKIIGEYTRNLLSSINSWKKELDFETLKQFLEKRAIHDFISSAFDWTETKEGFNFWADKHSKWFNRFYQIQDAKRNLHRTTSN